MWNALNKELCESGWLPFWTYCFSQKHTKQWHESLWRGARSNSKLIHLPSWFGSNYRSLGLQTKIVEMRVRTKIQSHESHWKAIYSHMVWYTVRCDKLFTYIRSSIRGVKTESFQSAIQLSCSSSDVGLKHKKELICKSRDFQCVQGLGITVCMCLYIYGCVFSV